jgi:hypothetical protein
MFATWLRMSQPDSAWACCRLITRTNRHEDSWPSTAAPTLRTRCRQSTDVIGQLRILQRRAGQVLRTALVKPAMNSAANAHARRRKTQPMAVSQAAVALAESLVRLQSAWARLVPTGRLRSSPTPARHPHRLPQQDSTGLGHQAPAVSGDDRPGSACVILHLKVPSARVRTGPSTSPTLPGQRHFSGQQTAPGYSRPSMDRARVPIAQSDHRP